MAHKMMAKWWGDDIAADMQGIDPKDLPGIDPGPADWRGAEGCCRQIRCQLNDSRHLPMIERRHQHTILNTHSQYRVDRDLR